MQIVAILALCIASGLAVPSGYGYSAPPSAPRALHHYAGYSAESLKSAPFVPIVRQLVQNDNLGTYNLEVEGGDGSKQFESGSMKNIGSAEGPVNVKKGSYSYISPEGQLFTVNYFADETGFHAEGSHLPTSPPIPEEIQKSLALPRIAEYQDEVKLVKSAPAPALYGGYRY